MEHPNKDKGIRVLQWNAQSAVAKKNSLEVFLYQNKIDIALISETWFQPGRNIKFPGYNIHREDRADGKAGVAIFISKKLTFRPINFIRNFNAGVMICGVEIGINNKLITLVSAYRPPNVKTYDAD